MTDRPDGYAALPKRFKDYIQQLENKVDALLRTQPSSTPTHVKILSYQDKGAEVYMPDTTRVQFTIGKERFVAQASKDYPGLEVRTEWQGMAILPNVSNVITIISRPRGDT